MMQAAQLVYERVMAIGEKSPQTTFASGTADRPGGSARPAYGFRIQGFSGGGMVRRAGQAGLLAAAFLAACAPLPEKPDPRDLAAARQAGLAFDMKMKREIIARLERGEDPVAVYLAYADNVPGWGKEISDAAQFDFSRTALGVRNPANAPDDWERRKMEEFGFLMDAGVDPEALEAAEIVQEGEEKAFRWMRPVQMTEPCMACHGEQLNPKIRLLLGQEYPADEAAGYSEGQIGGAYSVRKVLSIGGKPPAAYSPRPLPPRLPADQRRPDDAPVVQPAPVEAPPPERSPYDLPADPS